MRIIFSKGYPPSVVDYRLVESDAPWHKFYHDDPRCPEPKMIEVDDPERINKKEGIRWIRLHEEDVHGYVPSLLVRFIGLFTNKIVRGDQ